ncbi:hypothetical protein [Apibacter adventoris]|uniref:hypothetical protein n=1 Tax=Apibacter adventoris TaxID=1679466 RepID=UPI0021A78751|nr:hypothetical protein [Apibacter adventoris]
MPYQGKDHNDYVNGAGFCCAGKDKKLQTYGGGIGKRNEEYEKKQYYDHADHLGSSSYITNLDAQIVQHVEYVPFGEVFIGERNQSWNTLACLMARNWMRKRGYTIMELGITTRGSLCG